MSTQIGVDEQLCNIITFNGQNCSGKTAQSKDSIELLKKRCPNRKYKRRHCHQLRDDFSKNFYNDLENEDTGIRYKDTYIKYLDGSCTCKPLYQVEVIGIPSLAWLTANFHKEIRPLQENYTIVLDHYIGDYYADMLEYCDPDKFQCFVKNYLGISHFNQGIHFYLDIDYGTYLDRWKRDRETKQQYREYKVNQKDFEARRERYKELCEKRYLRCIDATMCRETVTDEVVKKIIEVWDKQSGCS